MGCLRRHYGLLCSVSWSVAEEETGLMLKHSIVDTSCRDTVGGPALLAVTHGPFEEGLAK